LSLSSSESVRDALPRGLTIVNPEFLSYRSSYGISRSNIVPRRLPSCRPRRSRRSFECCRTAKSCRLARPSPAASTCASWRPAIATSRRWWARGLFRADLLARISGFVVWLPPLRDRREDLGILIAALLKRQLADRAGEISFSCDAARALLLYPWPFNVRELEKWLATSMVLSGGHRIELEHLPVRVDARQEAPRAAANTGTNTLVRAH